MLATLVRLLGNLDLAEDAMQVAFAAAIEQWQKDGIPSNPRAWLISSGRFKAIDAIRRETRLFATMHEYALQGGRDDLFPVYDEDSIEDDRLRLIFMCCHPALPREAQLALTLREVCGLTTEEIAHAFLASTATIAQRIVRAKAKIREERISYEIPPLNELAERTRSVLHVIYLVFNEGYYASSGDNLTRRTLSEEAIRLGRILAELLPDPEVLGLLALMLLQESRRAARATAAGDLILLADQDQSLWDCSLIEEGIAISARTLNTAQPGPYALQAGIAAAHVRGSLAGIADWREVVRLYDLLLAQQPSPIVELNRAAAISMRDGPAAGIAILDKLLARGALEDYGLAYSALADMHRRLGNNKEAHAAYSRALTVTTQDAERRFLERRLKEVSTHT